MPLSRLVDLRVPLINLEQGRERRQRQDHRRGCERRPERDVGQNAAGGQAEQAATEQGELLRACSAGAFTTREELGDERAMGGRHSVQADVHGRGEDGKGKVRGRVAERDGDQAACSEQAAAEDEGQPRAETLRSAPVAPVADHERHCESRAGVHEHHEPDQPGRVVDPVEHDREIRRRHRSPGPGADRGRREGDHVGAAPRCADGSG